MPAARPIDYSTLGRLLRPYAPREWVFGPGQARSAAAAADSSGWREWLRRHFAAYVAAGFAAHHAEFWDWAWDIRAGERARPFVAIWPRGGGKSSSAELAVAALGVRRRRRYTVYVSETQEQADGHVASVATLLERLGQERAVNKYGSSRGWRRNRLRTVGFTVDALGLDTAARGIKIDEDRPDLMVFDDLDSEHDTQRTTEKKLATLTRGILPAGANNAAVLAIQNLVIPSGIFARLSGSATEKADFLTDRIVSGPHPAMRDLETISERDEFGAVRVVITGGEPTWEGQDQEACQRFIDQWGWSSFDREAQHNVGDNSLALWRRETIEANRLGAAPQLERIVVGVDPPGSTGRCGIVACGMARQGGKAHIYVLEDASPPAGSDPQTWARQVIATAARHQADATVVEVNQGGAMVKSTLRQVPGGERMRIIEVRASRDKRTRAEPIAAAAAEGRVHHVGVFQELEDQQCRWVPGDPSPDQMDAMVWAATELMFKRIALALAGV